MRARPYARKVKVLAQRFLEQLALGNVELSVSIVDDPSIRALNREWRRKDKPTDVLSFPAGELPPGVPVARPLGDIIISFDTTVRQALEYGRTVEEELARYLAHGLLHLLGYDHETASEAKKMAKLEDALLGAPGMVRTAARASVRKAPSTRAVSGHRDSKRGRGTKGRA